MDGTLLGAALAAAVLAAPSSSVTSRREILPFIADDYPKALAAARSAGKPIFLEAWAPW